MFYSWDSLFMEGAVRFGLSSAEILWTHIKIAPQSLLTSIVPKKEGRKKQVGQFASGIHAALRLCARFICAFTSAMDTMFVHRMFVMSCYVENSSFS